MDNPLKWLGGLAFPVQPTTQKYASLDRELLQACLYSPVVHLRNNSNSSRREQAVRSVLISSKVGRETHEVAKKSFHSGISHILGWFGIMERF